MENIEWKIFGAPTYVLLSGPLTKSLSIYLANCKKFSKSRITNKRSITSNLVTVILDFQKYKKYKLYDEKYKKYNTSFG